ncbi:MAG: patatin-like phospholipase family protein [Chloroflexi bacterium]|nr:patatin-like phospholipase family protein [Chloroflexota bacterium]
MTETPLVDLAARKKVGIALGGGVVRGMAHLGVLSVLEDAGIQVDVVAGSSAGALIGMLYSMGLNIESIRTLARRITWLRILRPTWPRRGFFTFEPMERWLVKELGPVQFHELKTPFAAVATDLISGKRVALTEGGVARAVRASSSVAGVIEPVEMNGYLLCDGNFSDSVPVSVARELGAEYVIGVDVFSHAIRKGWGAAGYLAAGVELLIRRSGEGIEQADCLITPSLKAESYLRFSKRDELFALGVKAAEEKLPDIQAALE